VVTANHHDTVSAKNWYLPFKRRSNTISGDNSGREEDVNHTIQINSPKARASLR
jgi:hypothetical protein